jgi:Holliday junction resolvase
MTEPKLQAEIIKYLKSRGCYVIKHNAGAGVPVGCPDLSAYYDGAVIFIEVKQTAKSKFQPLQKETLIKLKEWFGYVYVAHNNNWHLIKQELEATFF